MKIDGMDSLTSLLKAHAVALSAVRANRLMLELGLLEQATRDSATRPGVTKTFKRLTEAGLDYGSNVENPQSPGQTAPYYYVDSFAELAAKLCTAAAESDAGKGAGKGAGGRGGTETDGTA